MGKNNVFIDRKYFAVARDVLAGTHVPVVIIPKNAEGSRVEILRVATPADIRLPDWPGLPGDGLLHPVPKVIGHPNVQLREDSELLEEGRVWVLENAV